LGVLLGAKAVPLNLVLHVVVVGRVLVCCLLVGLPLVLHVVQPFVFLLHHRFVLVLLVPQLFLRGYEGLNDSDIALPLT
jgi:hypothetical protein